MIDNDALGIDCFANFDEVVKSENQTLKMVYKDEHIL